MKSFREIDGFTVEDLGERLPVLGLTAESLLNVASTAVDPAPGRDFGPVAHSLRVFTLCRLWRATQGSADTERASLWRQVRLAVIPTDLTTSQGASGLRSAAT